jgi:SAM-dependent methyltransferase
MHTKEINVESHYQENYFNNYQRKMGEFGGLANKFLFEDYITDRDSVLDFGCGGGFLLKNLSCKEKVGIEINPIAREYCNNINRIKCYPSLEYVSDESIDVVISCHCFEHTTHPYGLISELYDKLKKGGKIIVVIPLDSYKFYWKPNDINNHLYSFSPMNLGNILNAIGFKNIETQPVLHRWPPYYEKVYKIFGMKTFHMLSWVYGTLFSKRCVQIRGIGVK